MGRPPVPRRVGCRFGGRGMRPIGRPARGLPVVVLGMDELEALRLADLEGLYHQEAARRMGISRATFGRILASARRKLALALIEQQVLAVGEGPVMGPAGDPCCRTGGPAPRHPCHGRGRAGEEDSHGTIENEGGSDS